MVERSCSTAVSSSSWHWQRPSRTYTGGSGGGRVELRRKETSKIRNWSRTWIRNTSKNIMGNKMLKHNFLPIELKDIKQSIRTPVKRK